MKFAHVAMKEGLFVCVMVFISVHSGHGLPSKIPVVNFEWCKKVCSSKLYLTVHSAERVQQDFQKKKKTDPPTKFCYFAGPQTQPSEVGEAADKESSKLALLTAVSAF